MASKYVGRQGFFQELHVIILSIVVVNLALVTIVSGDGGGTNKTFVTCLEKERQALLKFKQVLVDDYGRLSSWGSGEDNKECCQWKGVHCSSHLNGHVISLDLHNSGLSFYHPLRVNVIPSLQELHHLSYLDLSNNNFQTQIPRFIGSLISLQYLILANSGFFGMIPHHQIGNLTNLRYLDLGNNYLDVKSLDWLSHLHLLRHLDLSSVHLAKINWVQPVNKLSFLTKLHMSNCGLRETSTSPLFALTNLSYTSLTSIDLSNNFFTSSSLNWIFNQSSLVNIDLSFNFFQHFPETFGNVIFLENLDFSSNSLEGEIPNVFGNLSHLRSLDLSSNDYISGQLSDFFKMFRIKGVENSLELLDLSSNQLSGSLPDFTRLSSLRKLDLSYNQLNGPFPESFGWQSSLRVLQLYGNQITGTLPDLRSFPSLQELDLSSNQLTGRLTELIRELSELVTLDASWNSFEGTISGTHFKKLSKLKKMDLSFNLITWEYDSDWVPPFQLKVISLARCKLGPQFPKWIQTQRNFKELDISSAGIFDTIPNWFWDVSPRLEYLNLSYNQISGFVPNLSVKLVRLYEMDLSSNQLEGSLPSLPPNIMLLYLSQNLFSGSSSVLCSSKFIGSLDISDNLLSGELSDCWAPMYQLVILNVANNEFSGRIPSSIGLMYQLQTLSLRNNSFTGELPISLSQGTRSCLRILDVSENRLSGSLPEWVGEEKTRLIVLSLRENEFSGSIPSNLCNLQDIQVLDLSQNNLCGNIPRCFNNFTSLVQRISTSRNIIFNFSAYNGREEYMGNAFVQWKGREEVYKKTLGLLKTIDLSGNKLVGEIPAELSSLKELISLNLSRNNLTGKIIQEIGQMRMLESLDLSRNHLSGAIPTGLAILNYLSVLDLSTNNLSGRIPPSTQLQGFNVSVYAGNLGLCGLPLPNKCPEDATTKIKHSKDEKIQDDDDDKLITRGFYVCMILGFPLGFWGVFGSVLLNHVRGTACFRFLDCVADWIYVTAVVNMARCRESDVAQVSSNQAEGTILAMRAGAQGLRAAVLDGSLVKTVSLDSGATALAGRATALV